MEKEVRDLGFVPDKTFITGLEFYGSLEDCIKLNLNLRCASQVHFSLKEFKANHPDDLYKELVVFPWEDYLLKDGYFSVTSNVDHPSINNNLYVNVKVKDAIVDRMTRETGRRPDSGSELKGAVIYVFWKQERVEVFVDTSGETLAKHGYRKIPGRAPMLEALAAATILATKWDRRAPFVNPMCGSGTVAIEAALLATNRKPGLLRDNYSFMHFKGYDDSVYKKALAEITAQVHHVDGLEIVASDISANAIKIAKSNAQEAGVENMITFQQCDFEETNVSEGKGGVVYFNPEYGERLGDLSELEATYARIGDFLKKKCKGYSGYIFTGNLELAKKIGLKASRRIEFYNAKLDCRLLEYELYSGTRRQLNDKPAEAE
ncbi:MAG TPA: class I SAM-dependent RNA methyltransferase [Chryseolinea sp.]